MPNQKIDTKTLTKAEKLALIDALDNKRRRDRSSRAAYAPNQGQTTVHKSEMINRFVFSGNGAGKTALGTNEAMWAMQGFNPLTGKYTPVPAKVAVVLDSPTKVEDVWLPEIQKWHNVPLKHLHKNGKPYYSSITNDSGSELQFLFHDQNPMIFESTEYDFVIFDEPPPRNLFVSLKRAGRRKSGLARYLFIGTPIGASWLRTDVWDKWSQGALPDTDCFRFNTEVNKHNLADGYIEEFSRHLTEKERRIRLEGEFFDLEGLALAHLFRRDTHIKDSVKWNPDWPVVVAVDPHPAKKHAALMLGVTPWDRLIVLRTHASKSTPNIFAKELKDMYSGYKVMDIIVDSLGATPMSGGNGNKSFIQVLQEHGVRCRATSFKDKNDEEWIERIQTVLAIPEEPDNMGGREPLLTILSSCRDLIHEIENVQWVKYRNMEEFKPSLDIANKDMLACLKYALATNISFAKTKRKIIGGAFGWNDRVLSYNRLR